MAKIGLTKLGLTKNTDVSKVEWNGEEIEVKQYLPIDDKLAMIAAILNSSIDDNGYYNPAKIYVYTIINMLDYYTNINFTDKQKEDISKTYDLVASSGLSSAIFTVISPYEYQQIQGWIRELVDSIYTYKNSIVGMMELIKDDYSNIELDAEKIQETLGDKENLTLLRDVMEKLG